MQVTSAQMGTELRARLAQVRVFAMDVDGVLTDGVLTVGNDGGEQKRFHVSDGLGLVALHPLDIVIVWISGRRSQAVERRAGELKIPSLLQGVRDKATALRQYAVQHSVPLERIAYLGDDWNDLPAFEVAGIRLAVADAAPEVRAAADFVTTRPGGRGAVREVCELLMEAHGAREQCLAAYLDGLRAESSDGSSVQ